MKFAEVINNLQAKEYRIILTSGHSKDNLTLCS